MWRPYDVYWLEEPVPPEDIRGYLAVKKRAGDTNIVGGEQNTGMAEFRDLLELGAVDIIQPGIGMVGGITEWLRVYRLATEFGVPVSPWQLQALNVHTCAGLPNVKWIEYFPPGNPTNSFQHRLFKEPHFSEEVTEEGVFLLPPEKPGIGLVLDEELAEQTRLST